MINEVKLIEFGTPSKNIVTRSWKDRLRVLYDGYPNKWAKFGTFKTKKAAQNAVSRIKSIAKENGIDIETHVEVNEKRESFIWIKVVVNAL